MLEAARRGVIGVLTGMFELTSTGITAAIIFSFFMALLFDPKGSGRRRMEAAEHFDGNSQETRTK